MSCQCPEDIDKTFPFSLDVFFLHFLATNNSFKLLFKNIHKLNGIEVSASALQFLDLGPIS